MSQTQQVSWLSQRLKNNIGRNDRFVRSLAGAGLVLAGWLVNIPEAFWFGLFLSVTATFKFCPNYAIFDFNTLGPDEVKTVIPWEEFLDLLPANGKVAANESVIPDATDDGKLHAKKAIAKGPESTEVQATVSANQQARTASDVSRKIKPAKALHVVEFSLPNELTHALIRDIEKNALDEMLVVRFFENFFGCKISIQAAAHLNIYVCKFPDSSMRLDFANLKARLLARLHETVQ